MDQAKLYELEILLDKDIVIAKQLQNLLEAEKDALVQRKADELQHLVESKLTLLDKLEKNHQQKIQLSGQQQTTSPPHWEDFIDKLHTDNNQLVDKLGAFKTILSNIEYQNKLNAKIASRMEQSISELISLLKGNSAQKTLYTQAGSAKQNSTHHSIAKA